MEDYKNMETNNKNITINLREEEALVFFEWLHNFNDGENSNLFQDQSEERVLWDIEAILEKNMSQILGENYLELLSNARKKIRDQE